MGCAPFPLFLIQLFLYVTKLKQASKQEINLNQHRLETTGSNCLLWELHTLSPHLHFKPDSVTSIHLPWKDFTECSMQSRVLHAFWISPYTIKSSGQMIANAKSTVDLRFPACTDKKSGLVSKQQWCSSSYCCSCEIIANRVHWMKALATKPDTQSSIPSTHRLERKNYLLHVVL